MVHMDLDSSDETDYSSFEYQTAAAEIGSLGTGSNNNPRVGAVLDFEPLESVGGLANNEIAELVYMEVTASIEYETESGDQSFDSSAEFRGAIGINLPQDDAALPGEGNFRDQDPIEVTQNTDALVRSRSRVDDRWLQLFETRSGAPFLDTAAGAGGGQAADHFHSQKNWRQLTGRGPVID